MTRGLILTLAYVPSPDTLLRPAAYRRNYAESNMNLFCPAEAPLERTYGILLHGGASMNRRPPREPTFARVVFPDASLRTYHQDYIDLFREFSHIVETLQKRDFVPVEVVPDNVQFELMPQQKEKRQA